MERIIFPRNIEAADKGDLPDTTPCGCQNELLELLQNWEKKALAVLKESEFHNEQKQWIHYNLQDIPDGEAREARLIVEAVQDIREALFDSENPCGPALAGIKLGVAVASAHALDFEADTRLGSNRRGQLAGFGKRRGTDLKTERKAEWKKWKKEAKRLKKLNPHLNLPGKKTELARKIKKNLSLDDSVRTIRSRI